MTSHPTDFAHLADALISVASEAGRVQMGHYRAGVAVETKSDSSPVTAADEESEVIILHALATIAPDIPVVAEEAVAAGNIPTIKDRFFLVDPLDGTREFINQRDEFTVNIGLIEQGAPTFGLVYAPALARLYVTTAADQVMRANLTPGDAAPSLAALDATRIVCRQRPDETLVAMASRSHSDEKTEALLAEHGVTERRSAGSSLKFCVLAEGGADFYPRPGRTMEWDTAAGHAVLAAAGGRVTNLDGTPFVYGKTGEGFGNPGFLAWAN